MNNLTEFVGDDVLHHDLIAKRQEVRRLTIDEAMAETSQFQPVDLTLSDRLQMATQGQPLYVVGVICFSLICAASLVAAAVGHLLAVFCCGAPGVWS